MERRKNDNKSITPEVWGELKDLVGKQLSGKSFMLLMGFAAQNKDTCLKVRFIMEVAWQAHFVKNMFIRPSDEELLILNLILL